MKNSILTRLLVTLSLILVLATGVSLYFANKNVRQIVEEKQVQLFKEKIDTLVRLLEARAKRLEMTRNPEAYQEDFQQAALDMIRHSYHTSDHLPLQSYPFILNKDKQTIFLPHLDNLDALQNAEVLIRDSLQYVNGGKHIILQSREIMGVFLPFPPWGWQIGYIVPLDRMYDASNRLQSILFSIMLIGTLTALAAMSFTVYQLVKPLRNLRKVADTVASGDYSRQFNRVFRKKDEVGSLARSLERMRVVIQERIAELNGANIQLQQEIQARKEADAARLSQELDYQQIFNATSEAIIIFDADEQRILHANNTMLDWFDCTLTEVGGQEIGNILQKSGGNNIDLFYRNIVQAVKGEIRVFAWPVKKQDGGQLWTEVSLRCATIGGRQCVLAAFRDVSERKLMEQEKMKIEEQLRHGRQMESIGTLAGGIAHDFNNLLTPLIGYAEMLIMQLENESEQQREAKAIYTAGLRARDLVKQILTISRKGDINMRPLLVQDEIAEVYSLVQVSLPKNIKITCDVDQSCEPVLADPGQIHQIIMNLSTNAYHAMKETGGVLSISLKKKTVAASQVKDNLNLTPGNYANIVVSDTGCGIAGETKTKIFDPYYTTKVAGEGTGLGLSIVHNIVNSIKGHITVESEKGKTVFSVYLPCLGQHKEINVIRAMDDLQTGDESIMLVDDEKSILDVSEAILQKLGYTVSLCHGSTEALAAFQVAPDSFDLIITDMTMPGMSGFELAMAIKKINNKIPILLLTGYSDIVDKAEAQKIGISAILTKPINIHNFSVAVRDALDRQMPRYG